MRARSEEASGRVGALAAVAVVGVALSTPVLLVGNAVRLLFNDWFLRHEYGKRAPLDLSDAERLDLGRRGLEAVEPGGAGLELLREAKLDGVSAFGADELAHMEDVASVLSLLYSAHLLAALAVGSLLALLLALRPRLAVLAAGLGGALTLLLGALAGAWALVGFGSFFESLHGLLFPEGNWRFPADSTLIQAYPEWLWRDAALWASGLVLGQALLLVVLGAAWRRARS